MSSRGAQPEDVPSSDPANPSTANSDHTTRSGEKPRNAYEAITDTTFLPTLDDAPVQQKAKSHSLLVLLVLGAVIGAWFMGFTVLQVSEERSWTHLALVLGSVTAAGLGALFWIGTATIDLWSLVMEWGWYSIPFAGLAGVAFVIMQERTERLSSVD